MPTCPICGKEVSEGEFKKHVVQCSWKRWTTRRLLTVTVKVDGETVISERGG